jgi:hypothetical protein
MATLISNMVGDTTNGAAAKANRKSKGSARSSSARRTINVTSINPNASVSARTAARTTTDLGAPRVSRSTGLQR